MVEAVATDRVRVSGGFLMLIEMEFLYTRMIFRSYAQTKSFSGKGKVSVL